MPSSNGDDGRDYGFADQAVALRKRAGLTQRELGALLGVSEKAIGAWEAGLTYPGAERLQPLIALYLARAAFGAGREEEEAVALWESVRTRAPRRSPPFDPRWFASLRATGATAVPSPSPQPSAPTLSPRRHHWGDAPATPVVQGRVVELATLAAWVRDERCRVVEVLGVGGIGKTTLAAHTVHDLAPAFTTVYWRSLRNAPPPEEWLAGALGALSGGQAVVPDGLDARLRLLLDLLRDQRALLVLDNFETVLEPGAPTVRYRAGYAGYEEALRRLAEGMHAGCVLLTSREQPLSTDDVAGEGAVRALRLEGLGVDAGQALLGSRGLAGDAAAWRTLVARCGGNPLALRVVGETINAVFGGDITAFLAQGMVVFGGIRQVLDAQEARLSPLERAVLTWLTVEREPVGFAEIVADLGPGVARGEVVEAVEALLRRSLLEWGSGGTFTVQPVVLEHATMRLVDVIAGEVLAGESGVLGRVLVVKATAKDYVRRSQERLIAQPLLELLTARCGGAEVVEQRLLALLETWRGRPAGEQGYGPGAVVNLLRLLRGDLRGLNLSRLHLRQAYLQGVEAQEASLADAHLSEAVLDEAFTIATAVVLSADGACLAAGTSIGEVYLWRVADRALLQTVQGHGGPILGVALSADGRLLASCSHGATIEVWAAQSGQLLTTLRGHTGRVWGVALSGDGRLLASASQDGTVRLWDAGSEQVLATLRGHTSAVRGVALSADGRLAASGGEDGTVRLWDAGEGQPLATLQAHAGQVLCVALSADGQLVAGGGEDGVVRLWDVGSRQVLATLRGHTGRIWRVALSGDGRLLASASQDGTVRLWDAGSEQVLATLRGHSGDAWWVTLSGDGRLLASGGQDGTVKLYGAPDGRLLATLQGNSRAVLAVALSGDGRLLASASQDGMVRLWDVPSGQVLATLRGHTSAVRGVALSADGRLAASASFDGTVRLWEAPNGQALATLQGHTGGVMNVALSADGRVLASGGEDGTVRLWEARTGLLLTTLEGHNSGVWGVALSANGRVLASSSLDGTIRLWEVESGRLLATLQGHTGGVMNVALSADGRVLASGGEDWTIRLWDALDGRSLATLQGHTDGVVDVALSADGRLAASSSFDGSVRLWDAGSGRLLATLQGHTGGVVGVALSADGQLTASGSLDGTVRLWDTGSGAWRRTLRDDLHYERMDITGLSGVTEAQRTALVALGAVEHAPAPPALSGER